MDRGRPSPQLWSWAAHGALLELSMASPESTAKIRSIEERLIDLDPIFREFCARYGFNLRGGPELYPKRVVWRREELDRVMDLSPDVSVAEVMEKGFYPDMRWSLYANASLLPKLGQPVRMLSLPIFQRIAYSELRTTLVSHLEEGYNLLRAITLREVMLRGHAVPGSA